MIAVELERVSASYGDQRALTEVSCTVETGEILGVIGPNGSGKTTLLRLLSGVIPATEGTVWLFEEDLRVLSSAEIARRVAVVPQESSWAFPCTALEAVLLGRQARRAGGFFDGPEDVRVAREALAAVGLLSVADRPVDRLSGGERQKVVIARALAQEPSLLLLDEPTANLDIAHQGEILDLLSRINREREVTIISTFHDLSQAALFCPRLVLLSGGQGIRLGSPEEVMQPDILEKVYGCPVEVRREISSGHLLVLPRWGGASRTSCSSSAEDTRSQ